MDNGILNNLLSHAQAIMIIYRRNHILLIQMIEIKIIIIWLHILC